MAIDEQSPPPQIALLNQAFSMPWDSQLPLHARVHRGLRYAIENFFEDGQRFFTEKELIDHLKVSQVTVRRAVYDLVREGMLERRVAKGSFVRKRPKTEAATDQIAIHLEDWESSFLSSLLRCILTVCHQSQRQSKVYYSTRSGDVMSRKGEAWNQADIGGAILISLLPDHAANLDRLYRAAGKNVVCIDSRGPKSETHFVGTDNLQVTKIGLDHLTSLGHEEICLLVNEPEEHENVKQWIKFFESEARSRKLKKAKVVRAGTKFWEDSYVKAYEAMPEVMAQKPTAVFAFDDPGAWAALKWCSQHKVRVPEDLSVIGFANDKPSAFTHPALTTIAHPIEEIATTALEMLGLDAGKPQTRLLHPTLVVRESTARR